MDTSEQYIKMCEKATEIEKDWQPAGGDYIFCNLEDRDSQLDILSDHPSDGGAYGHGTEVGDECHFGNYGWRVKETREQYEKVNRWVRFKEDHVWLPRQDQLQEMVTGYEEHWQLVLDFADFVRENASMNVLVNESLEQLWLAFVMAEYSKIWNGDNWLYANKGQ